MRAHRRASLATMKRAPVESEIIASVGYDAQSRTLEVELVHRAIYQYRDVPGEVHVALLAADSKGRFFNDAIRDSYACIRVT